MKRYSNDPKTLTARFASKCNQCGVNVSKGDEIFYYPLTKTALGMKCGCGDTARREFESAAMDEEFFA